MVNTFTRRQALALAGATIALGVTGCAATDRADDRISRPLSAAGSNGLLTPWLSINGGWRVDSQQPIRSTPITGPRLLFVQPVGVAVQGDVLLVADAGARTLWRLDRSRDSMVPFAPFTGGSPEQGASLQMGNDFSAWIALPSEHSVVQYDFRAREVRRWRDDANAPQPVAVAVPEDRSEILVGDAATAQVVVFSPLGRTLRLLNRGRSQIVQSIAAMTLGPAGLYVLDRIAQQVVVLGASGDVLEVIGENQLVRPRAMAVDRSGRLFVSDDVDQRIKVFRGAQLLGTAGGFGAGPARFGRIEAMAIDGNLLYVADSLNARVQVLLVAPPSMEGPGATP
jgi:DNA-binding beta-propeller fold protein YncE